MKNKLIPYVTKRDLIILVSILLIATVTLYSGIYLWNIEGYYIQGPAGDIRYSSSWNQWHPDAQTVDYELLVKGEHLVNDYGDIITKEGYLVWELRMWYPYRTITMFIVSPVLFVMVILAYSRIRKEK